MTVESNESSTGISSDRLNLILAICAILISGASFYATYLQAQSAEKQVKAMTMPLLQFTHGNYDIEKEKKVISLNIKNAGVGPAIIKDISFAYKDKQYSSLHNFFNACCNKSYNSFLNKENLEPSTINLAEVGGSTSAQLLGIIIPGQNDYTFRSLYYGSSTQGFWKQLNTERFNLEMHICYCSLLDDCFISEKSGVVEQVDSCPKSRAD